MKKLALTLALVSSLSIAAFAYWVPAAGSPSTQQVGDLKVTLVPYTKELDQANFKAGAVYTNPEGFVVKAFLLTVENGGEREVPVSSSAAAFVIPNGQQVFLKSDLYAFRSGFIIPHASYSGLLVFEPDYPRQKSDGPVSVWLPQFASGQTIHFDFDWVKK